MRSLTCATLMAALASFAAPVSADPTPKPDGQEKKTQPEKKDQKSDKKNPKEKKETTKPMPALAFTMKDINGKEQDLRQFQGNVVLMVNVASKCGLTPQYEGLEKLYETYKDRGFVILGFPANNFLKQEPGTDEEIRTFCTKNYGVTFPMFSKVSVKGKDKCDLYKYLTDKKADHGLGGAIEWNFGKFLVDRDGKVVNRFSPRTTPDDKAMLAALEAELKKAIPEDSALARKLADEKKKEKKPAPKA
ncbi:MAG TPA: glutathione peroxidase [Phycisphaerae bacterium]|nr:glutathione peroxidase [Phycisphaerae bacterium]HRW54617.1 glutathione peroxidase [Phycisphaerae bacterium]